MFISGTSGHATEDTQHKYPYMVSGRLLKLNFAKPIYQLNLQQQTGGTITGSPVSGESGTTFNLSATSNNKYTFDGFSVTGAALTGSAGTYTNSDVTAKGNWTYHPEPVFVRSVTGRIYEASKRVGSAEISYAGTLASNQRVAVSSISIPYYGIGWTDVKYRDDVSGQHTALGYGWGIMQDSIAASANPPVYLTEYTATVGSYTYTGIHTYVYLSGHSGQFYTTTDATTQLGSKTAHWAGAIYEMV